MWIVCVILIIFGDYSYLAHISDDRMVIIIEINDINLDEITFL